MLDLMDPGDESRIHEVRAEYRSGRVSAFGERRDRAEAEVWGDDSSWKIQYLDLSSIREGVIRRDDRFGYLKLATDPKLTARDFIRCSSWEGERRVEFYIERGFSLATGTPIADEDW
jgi:hypothetical protein